MQSRYTQAFSLVELIVSIGIISMLFVLTVFNYGTANDNLSVNSAGEEIAISIRQAQVFGLSVKEAGVGTDNFSYAYGVYFNPTNNPSDFVIFADKNNNLVYDVGSGCGSGSTECVEKVNLRNNVKITSVCDDSNCPPSGTPVMHVTFIRPNPDSRTYYTTTGNTSLTGPATNGRVVLTSPKGKTVTVWIGKSGSVLVQ